MEPIKTIRSRTAVLPLTNIDTDQIIPARFLRATTREGFGKHLFSEWRYDANGNPKPDFVLNKPEAQGCSILVAGRNFGCGSSREHAVWALYDYGFRAAIAPSFGDIFFINCLKNGLLPIVLPEAVVLPLLDTLSASPGSRIAIDLPAQTATLPDGSAHAFEMEPFAKACLLRGMDEIDYTLSHQDRIDAYERSHAQPY
jgi:3-isopropylmalate/(R)-2-methylmalate dehydratase small subunit